MSYATVFLVFGSEDEIVDVVMSMRRFFSKMCTDCPLALVILYQTCSYQNNLKGQNVRIEKMPLLCFHETNLSVSAKN